MHDSGTRCIALVLQLLAVPSSGKTTRKNVKWNSHPALEGDIICDLFPSSAKLIFRDRKHLAFDSTKFKPFTRIS